MLPQLAWSLVSLITFKNSEMISINLYVCCDKNYKSNGEANAVSITKPVFYYPLSGHLCLNKACVLLPFEWTCIRLHISRCRSGDESDGEDHRESHQAARDLSRTHAFPRQHARRRAQPGVRRAGGERTGARSTRQDRGGWEGAPAAADAVRGRLRLHGHSLSRSRYAYLLPTPGWSPVLSRSVSISLLPVRLLRPWEATASWPLPLPLPVCQPPSYSRLVSRPVAVCLHLSPPSPSPPSVGGYSFMATPSPAPGMPTSFLLPAGLPSCRGLSPSLSSQSVSSVRGRLRLHGHSLSRSRYAYLLPTPGWSPILSRSVCISLSHPSPSPLPVCLPSSHLSSLLSDLHSQFATNSYLRHNSSFWCELDTFWC